MMLRLAAAASSSSFTVFPGAIRILSNAFTANSAHQNLIITNNFCTDAKNSIDRKLVKALKSEIKSIKLSSVPAAPDDFPFTIDIEEDPKRKTAGLRRELNGEKIYVSVAMPEMICTSSAGSVCLYVRIGKPNGKLIDFGARMCPHVIHVGMMSVMEPSPRSPDKFLCLGVHDVEAEGKLQSALQEYLKIRGILPSYAEFMHKYMVSAAKKEHLNDLKKMINFIRD